MPSKTWHGRRSGLCPRGWNAGAFFCSAYLLTLSLCPCAPSCIGFGIFWPNLYCACARTGISQLPIDSRSKWLSFCSVFICTSKPPSIASQNYGLRQRAHSLQLPERSTLCKWCMRSVRRSNMICPEVKMSTRGRSPSVDIFTEGHIILEWRTMNIMHHMFCGMTNCDKIYRRMKIIIQEHCNYQTKCRQRRFYIVDSKKDSKCVTDIIFSRFIRNFL